MPGPIQPTDCICCWTLLLPGPAERVLLLPGPVQRTIVQRDCRKRKLAESVECVGNKHVAAETGPIPLNFSDRPARHERKQRVRTPHT